MGASFDRTIINPREKPLSQDMNSAQSNGARSLLNVLDALLLHRESSSSSMGLRRSGFLADSFKVRAQIVPNMSVYLKDGLGLFDNTTTPDIADGGIVGLDDVANLTPLVNSALQTINIPAAPTAGTNRIDIIEVRLDRRQTTSTLRKILNAVTGVFVSTVVSKTFSFDLNGDIGQVTHSADSTAGISLKTGLVAAAGSETEPAVSSGYVKIAAILVAGGATVINANCIQDSRAMQSPSSMVRAAIQIGVHITTASPLEGTTSLLKLMAPPGLLFGFAQPANFTTGATWSTIYVFAGGTAPDVIPSATFQAQDPPGLPDTVIPPVSVLKNFRTGTVDATVQSHLANATPGFGSIQPLSVAIGQPYFAFDWVVFGTFTDDTDYQVAIGMDIELK